MTVKELVEKLKELDPEIEARVWDLGWGDNVPITDLDVYRNYVVLECHVPAPREDEEA